MVATIISQQSLLNLYDFGQIQIIEIHLAIINTIETSIKATTDIDNYSVWRLAEKLLDVLVVSPGPQGDVHNQFLIQFTLTLSH